MDTEKGVYPRIDFVRMDIERNEWDVLESWLEHDLFNKFQVSQFLMEIHLTGSHESDKRESSILERLVKEAGFRMFWVARNP